MKLRLLLILLLLLSFATITQAQPVEGCGTYFKTDSCSWFEFEDNRFKIILPYDDLTVLSDFLQDRTKRPGCLANADPNGDCLINIGDLI